MLNLSLKSAKNSEPGLININIKTVLCEEGKLSNLPGVIVSKQRIYHILKNGCFETGHTAQGPEVPFTYKFLQLTFDYSGYYFGSRGVQKRLSELMPQQEF